MSNGAGAGIPANGHTFERQPLALMANDNRVMQTNMDSWTCAVQIVLIEE